MNKIHFLFVFIFLFVASFAFNLHFRGQIKSLKEEILQLSTDIESLKKVGKITAEKMGEEKKALQQKIRAMVAQIKKREANLKKLKRRPSYIRGN